MLKWKLYCSRNLVVSLSVLSKLELNRDHKISQVLVERNLSTTSESTLHDRKDKKVWYLVSVYAHPSEANHQYRYRRHLPILYKYFNFCWGENFLKFTNSSSCARLNSL